MVDFTKANYGELGDALCALKTEDEAAEFWHAYVQYLRSQRFEEKLPGGKTPEQVAAANIGYLMGYYEVEERQRVYGLFAKFDVSHPVFGRSEPSPEEAFAAGEKLGKGELTLGVRPPLEKP